MNVWWCNQSSGWKKEQPRGVVCSSICKRPTFRRTVGEARRGDIIVHYRTGQGVVAISRAKAHGKSCTRKTSPCGYPRGWFFRTEYHDLEPIPLAKVRKDILALGLEHGPIKRDGLVKQAYFIPFDLRGLLVLKRA